MRKNKWYDWVWVIVALVFATIGLFAVSMVVSTARLVRKEWPWLLGLLTLGFCVYELR
jgi:hypothetical protein